MTSVQRKRKEVQSFIESQLEEDSLFSIFTKTMLEGKSAMDRIARQMGVRMVEALLYMEQEQLTGEHYSSASNGIYQWGSQQGSVYIGDRKEKVKKPRVRGPKGEVKLKLYDKLKDPGQFSEELLNQVFNGLSVRRYQETLSDTADALGTSASSVSKHIKAATAKRLKEFVERDLSDFDLFGMFLDGINFHGTMYIVAMGINLQGSKQMLGFWEGATENNDVCKELLDDLERRGLTLHKGVVYVTDGGSGIIKGLREKFGKDLIHQRCIIHKQRNIVNHLPKSYRAEAKRRFKNAVTCVQYHDAKEQLKDMANWLGEINISAESSLNECLEELITLQRINAPKELRTTLRTTNPIESTFSQVREINHKVKRNRGTAMGRRWMAALLLRAESSFKRTFGKSKIIEFSQAIKGGMTSIRMPKKKKVA